MIPGLKGDGGMYLRFVVTQIDEDSHQQKGLFITAYELYDSGGLSPEELTQLGDILIWFEKKLPSPDSANFRNLSYRAIFWFKSEADDCISRIWEMAHLLEYHGYLIEMQKCRWLGNIAYEDKFQVAAIPSKDDRK
jgi:hypothetical protein